MGGNLATNCGRKNKRLTPFSTALEMSDRNGHKKATGANLWLEYG